MTEQKTPEPKTPEPKTPEPKKVTKPAAVADPIVTIQTVYGRMVDPHTGLEYDLKPCELFKLTPWVQSQLDAGKMKLVT